jgi:N-acetyl sugar amidotransferase
MKDYQICTNCIMDTSDKEISFDERGICSNCRSFEKKVNGRVFRGEEGQKRLNEFIEEIKKSGEGKEYDCIIGLSGGVDSSYLAYLVVKKFGLRPLAVHLDNGWNSKIATKNIYKIVKNLGMELYTYVIDWEEFKDLQLAYLKSSVIDIEALTDHAIKATLYKKANETGTKYIISGVNLATEGILPKSWRYNKGDSKNILDIYKKFGTKQIKTFPILTILERIYYQSIKGIREIEVLNYLDYNKEEAKKTIIKNLGWEDYGGKHGESIFTKFYQDYILLKKFRIDKRRAHLSTLVCSGQLSREKALEEIKKSAVRDEDLKIEKEYVLRKLDLNEKEFEKIMSLPIRDHHEFKNSDKLFKSLRKIYLKFLKK